MNIFYRCFTLSFIHCVVYQVSNSSNYLIKVCSRLNSTNTVSMYVCRRTTRQTHNLASLLTSSTYYLISVKIDIWEHLEDEWYLYCRILSRLLKQELKREKLLAKVSWVGIETTHIDIISLPHILELLLFLMNSLELFLCEFALCNSIILASTENELKGKVVYLVAPDLVENYPEVYLENINGTIILRSGLSVDIIRYLQDALGFRVNVIVSNNFPSYYKGQWTGMGYYLFEGIVDIAIAAIAYVPIRRPSFDFLVPHFEAEVSAYFVQPRLSTTRNHFIYPFSKVLWISSFFMLIISVLTSSLMKMYIMRFSDCFAEIDRDALHNHVAVVLGIFSQQGCTQPSSFSLKLFFVAIWMLSAFICIYYTSALFSALSAVDIPISDFDDLMHSSLQLVAEEGNDAITTVVKGWADNVENSIYFENGEIVWIKTKFGSHVNFESTSTGAEKSLRGSSAFLMSGSDYYSALRALNKSDFEICSTSSFSVSRSNMKMGMLLRKNSPYKELFSVKMIKMWENGLLPLYESHYISNIKPKCHFLRSRPSVLVLGFIDLWAAFAILCAGALCAVLSLTMEILMGRNKHPAKMNRTTATMYYYLSVLL